MSDPQDKLSLILQKLRRDYLIVAVASVPAFSVIAWIGIWFIDRGLTFRQALLLLAVAALVFVVAYCILYTLNRRRVLKLIRPIEHLSEAVGRMQKTGGEFSCSSELTKRKDEIGQLTRAFAAMYNKIEALTSDLEQRLRDIKQVQADKRESETRCRNLFNTVPIGLYRTSPDGRIIDVNSALIHMLGYASGMDWSGINSEHFYADPSKRMEWKEKAASAEGSYVCEKQVRRSDGSLIWVEDQSRALRDAKGRVTCFEGSLRDITESKLAKLTLKENEQTFNALYEEFQRVQELYRVLVDASTDAVIICDLTGRTQYVNPIFTDWFGWTMEDVQGIAIPFVPEPVKIATETIFRQLAESGMPCREVETKRFTKHGHVLDVSLTAVRFEDHAGNPAGILMILKDISENKRLQAQLQHAGRMETIGTLAGGIAHDFNNLMMGMQGNVSLMLCGMERSHPYYEKLKGIENMIESGAKLTRHLLGYARKGRDESHPVNINKLVRDCVETFGRTHKGITLHLQLADQINAIEADRVQIEQILMNLYINAGDAMPQGGDLFLKTEMIAHDQFGPKLYAPHPGDYILLTVTDTGEGIAAEHLKRIFDPFFTTKEMGRGTGLGLASVYGIIKAHGGYIDVSSKLGEGTTFKVYLPSTATEIDEPTQPTEQIVAGKGKILIVDDEALVIEVSSEMLEKAGYTVLTADNGREAVARFQEQGEQIDLVILDMVMPRMDGSEVFDHLKSIRPDAKVLIASGHSIEGPAARILKRGCDGFIQKPYSLQQLTRKIEEILTPKKAF